LQFFLKGQLLNTNGYKTRVYKATVYYLKKLI